MIDAKIKQLQDYLKPMDKNQIAEKLIEAEANTVNILNIIYDIFARDLSKFPSMVSGNITLTFNSEFRYQNIDAYKNYPYICNAVTINGCYQESPYVKINGLFNSMLLKELLDSNGFIVEIKDGRIDININIKTKEVKDLYDRAFTKRGCGSEFYYSEN